MAFDVAAVLKDMSAAAGGVLSAEGPKIRDCARRAIEDEKAALEQIALARLAGEITAADMKDQIDDEKAALRAALLVCQVKGKLAAQRAANAALKVFDDAVKVALKAL